MSRKADLNRLRRNVAPARDAIAALGSIAGDLVTESTGPYLRDCQDHVQQIHDLVESYRDTVASLIDIHLNVASQRMNEIMKVLTIIATIFMPLGLIAGIYGMNFDPEASPTTCLSSVGSGATQPHWRSCFSLRVGSCCFSGAVDG